MQFSLLGSTPRFGWCSAQRAENSARLPQRRRRVPVRRGSGTWCPPLGGRERRQRGSAIGFGWRDVESDARGNDPGARGNAPDAPDRGRDVREHDPGRWDRVRIDVVPAPMRKIPYRSVRNALENDRIAAETTGIGPQSTRKWPQWSRNASQWTRSRPQSSVTRLRCSGNRRDREWSGQIGAGGGRIAFATGVGGPDTAATGCVRANVLALPWLCSARCGFLASGCPKQQRRCDKQHEEQRVATKPAPDRPRPGSDRKIAAQRNREDHRLSERRDE